MQAKLRYSPHTPWQKSHVTFLGAWLFCVCCIAYLAGYVLGEGLGNFVVLPTRLLQNMQQIGP